MRNNIHRERHRWYSDGWLVGRRNKIKDQYTIMDYKVRNKGPRKILDK